MAEQLTPPASEVAHDRLTTLGHLPASTDEHRVDPAHPAARGSGISDDQLLLQASRIAETLRGQYSELDRREQAIQTRISEFESEERAFRLRVSEAEQALADRANEIEQQNREVESVRETLDKQRQQHFEKEESLAAERAAINAERARLRESVEEQLNAERAALREEKEKLAAREAEIERLAREQAAAFERDLEAHRNEIAREREQLYDKLQAEWDRKTESFRQEQAEWELQRQAQIEEIANERETNERLFAQVEQEMSDRREELQAEAEQMLTAGRARLAEERSALEAELERGRQQVLHERAMWEQRMRLQHDALAKARDVLEAERRAADRELQQKQADFAHATDQIRLRRTQLDHYRQLLDDRERSHLLGLREQQQAIREREREVERDRARLDMQRTAWESDRSAQQQALARRSEMLDGQSDNLEARRERLDQLRAELEESHRTTLEMRVALEEAWARISKSAGDDKARSAVESSKRKLEKHHKQLAESTANEKQTIVELRGQLKSDREALREEQHKLQAWIDERDQSLRTWETDLRRDAEGLETRDAAWRRVRDRWLQEKQEAEAIIRDLLRQISVADVPVQPVPLGTTD